MQKIKGAKVSVADSRPFATPSRSCRAELAEPLSADSAQTEPCAPIRDKFAFGKFCFFSPTYFFLKYFEHFGIFDHQSSYNIITRFDRFAQ